MPLSTLRSPLSALVASLVALALLSTAPPVHAGHRRAPDDAGRPGGHEPVRFATFNASLNRSAPGQLVSDLSEPGNAQADAVAEIIQRARPDVLLLNEFDHDEDERAIDLFAANYLEVAHEDAVPIHYPYRYTAPSNTGIASGLDLNGDGTVGGPDDAYGFGFFPGQYGMAVYSRFPIDEAAVRTFQLVLWADMPGALLPDDLSTPEPADFYSQQELAVLRLSSKSHWDIPIDVHGSRVHLLAAHPTPPVFDGPEDRNGRRNHDEIRFWADYVHPSRGGWITDDQGRTGGLPSGARFVMAGDYNADPFDGDSVDDAILQLLDHPKVDRQAAWPSAPTSAGAVEAATLQGGANDAHEGDPAFDTADFADTAPGNLRVDYVLPSSNLRTIDAGVFWPTQDEPTFDLVGEFPFPSSDHRLVWVDVRLAGRGR